MKTIRTIVLIGILMPLWNLNISAQETNAPKNSLAQFTVDMIFLDGYQHGLDSMSKYMDSELFYVNPIEFFTAGQNIYREGRMDIAIPFMKKMNVEFQELDNSFVHQLFISLIDSGISKTRAWLDSHRNDLSLNMNEYEFDLASTSLLRANKIAENRILSTIYMEEFPNSTDPYHQMADVALAEGNEKLAIQYYKAGISKQDYTSFGKLAIEPLAIYQPSILPRDTSLLFRSNNLINQDTAWVFIQGGPMPDISAYNPRPLDLLPHSDHLLKIDVLQTQMMNQTIINADPPLTTEQCLYEHERNAEMVFRTVKYLKDRGKVVYLIGHSYGGQISYEYLHSKEDLSDKLILMASDLNEDPRNDQLNPDGSRKFIRFRDGITPYERDFFSGFTILPIVKPNLDIVFHNLGSLVRSHRSRMFRELLKDKDLSNIIFMHGRFDESNARTSPEDLEFWKSHGAKTIETYGNHHSMLSRAYMENIYNHLTKGSPLKKSVASQITADLEHMSIDKAIKNYHYYKDQVDFYPINQDEINALGYRLVTKNDLESAEKIFHLNVQSFPNSWNTYDSLGETQIVLGKFIEGQLNYKKSLRLNPGNVYGISALRQ